MMLAERHGCEPDLWRSLRDIGRQLMATGVSKCRTPLRAFQVQRANAHRRGVVWKLTLSDWWDLWENSGKWDQRGTTGTSYVMCRREDNGAYESDNVFIDLACNNNSLRQSKKSNLPVGVIFAPKKVTFKARRTINGKRVHLGTFSTPALAHDAFLQAASDLPRPTPAETAGRAA